VKDKHSNTRVFLGLKLNKNADFPPRKDIFINKALNSYLSFKDTL
jgi:hypothetical protein